MDYPFSATNPGVIAWTMLEILFLIQIEELS